MSLSLKITETTNIFLRKIGAALAPLINSRVNKNKSKIIRRVKEFVEAQIKIQPEVQELTLMDGPGSLNAMLGITSAEAAVAVDAIIREITNTMRVDLVPFNKSFRGGINLIFSNIDIHNLSLIPEGSKITLSGNLDWLNWLLVRGDAPIIIGYRYKADTRGRTGGGIMLKGSFFRIPPKFSGTTEDNFITRALSGEEQEAKITKIFQEILG